MKKIAGTIISLAIIASMAFTYSCTKDESDVNAPVITIIGDNPLIITLQDGNWTDPGATATDDKDGSVTVTSTNDVNPNFQASTYKITYSATDAAGNTATAIRTVHVVNDAVKYEGNYSGIIYI